MTACVMNMKDYYGYEYSLYLRGTSPRLASNETHDVQLPVSVYRNFRTAREKHHYVWNSSVSCYG